MSRGAAQREYPQELDFVLYGRTGVVHVMRPWGDGGRNSLADAHGPESTFGALTSQTVMMCGREFLILSTGGPHETTLVWEFPDTALCGGCHRAMGAESHRAFEHPQPGGDWPPGISGTG